MCTSLSATNNSRRDINKQLAEMYVYVCARETSSGWLVALSINPQAMRRANKVD